MDDVGDEEGDLEASSPRESLMGKPFAPKVGDRILSMENLSRPW